MLRILIVLSLVLTAFGLGTAGFVLLTPSEPPTEAAPVAPPPTLARVLVAARALPGGTLLRDEDLSVREVAPDSVPPGAALEAERADLRGGLLRRFVEGGEPVPPAEVVRPRDRGFLAAVLRPGYRAVAVGVDQVTGAAGLIWPGDRVDLILTQELAAADAPLGRRVIGETVLSDVRVLAVDQQFTGGPPGALPGLPDGAVNRVARTVSVEVTAEGAERVAVASRLGRISLTVRAVEMPEAPVASGSPVFGSDVSPALARSAVSQGARMRLIQGDSRQEVVFR